VRFKNTINFKREREICTNPRNKTIGNTPPLVGLQIKNTNNVKSEVRFKQLIRNPFTIGSSMQITFLLYVCCIMSLLRKNFQIIHKYTLLTFPKCKEGWTNNDGK
jgi:hypothetical protein